MNKTKLICAALALSTAATASAGGILTNTNQNIAFLRNPAQDAVIGIAGVYSNPAGVAFMNNGFHLSLNIQNAHQTREITSTFAPFAYGANNFGNTTKTFKGEANAPIIPSIQAAYNKTTGASSLTLPSRAEAASASLTMACRRLRATSPCCRCSHRISTL